MKELAFLLLLAVLSLRAFCQESVDPAKEKIKDIPKHTDFSVPSSPAFILLDVTPAKVNKPAFTRDFKFDWIFSGNNISPNIAIEAQPIWLLFYKNKSFTAYQKESSFAKRLSSLSFSLGTVKKDSLQSLAWGFKLNLLRQKDADPMENTEYIDALKSAVSISADEKALWKKLTEKEEELAATEDDKKKKAIQKTMDSINVELNTITDADKQKITKIKKDFSDKYWNANMLDVGYGNAYSYFGESVDNLKFAQQTSGFWANLSYNFNSKYFLLSGLYKYLGKDTSIHFLGGNLRYGSSKLNFFAEYVYETSSDNKKNTIAYGGDFRVSDQLQIQFGIRTAYDQDFKLTSLKPLVNLNWLLKNNGSQ